MPSRALLLSAAWLSESTSVLNCCEGADSFVDRVLDSMRASPSTAAPRHKFPKPARLHVEDLEAAQPDA